MMTNVLENFTETTLDERLQWHSPPENWSISSQKQVLTFKPLAETDFWQKTHYGFRVDNGHFLFAKVQGDFQMTTRVRTYPVHQYDQAGLMVRFSDRCWLKTSVEFETDGHAKLGAVVTNNGYSDWSTQNFQAGFTELMFRITRVAGDYTIEYAEPTDDNASEPAWQQMRIAHLFDDVNDQTPFQCGVYACCPQGHGCEVEFDFLHIVQLDMPTK
ncbi:DUF1349 domain-containing protein [Paenibacillus sp. SGZ-1009]|uniref:DUF1349 domain-containing protein n=1 Tax=Paenibacillus campi TaxID=3106031 RepID=UPI003A4C5B5E